MIRIFSGATVGLEAFPIEVEVDATPGLHFFNIVGLPDKTVEESKDRIASAIKNSGFTAPKQMNQRIIINLAPADIRKEGPGYDLPIALGFLLATKQFKFGPKKRIFLGELSLDGSVRRLNGILPIVAMAKQNGFDEVILPIENAQEAAIVHGARILGVSSLAQVIGYLQGAIKLDPLPTLDYHTYLAGQEQMAEFEMNYIKGQETAKRALLIAAAGGHNILMYGPPGSGKTLLAKALAGIMPPMDHEEAIEVTKIYSVAGMTGSAPLITQRPFRSPHHSISTVAIVGGGSWPRPGEITLAHRGVLFLDEFPEFPRSVLEALRQPMESGEVVISRAASSIKFPARFMLVAAMNPCPCGNFGDPIKACTCNEYTVAKYQRKVSGPILDRIDIQINVSREGYDKLKAPNSTDQSPQDMRAVIAKTREVQQKRFVENNISINAEMRPKEIEKYCTLTADAEKLMRQVVTSHNISGRGYHKILKLARTIADIDSCQVGNYHSGHVATIKYGHVAEAVGYRIKNELV